MAEVESPDLITGLQEEAALSPVEQTYKARDVEGWLDIHFYRPLGFQLARLFALAGLTPSTVSLFGAGIGMLAGHLYFYPDLRVNLIGLGLQATANTFDNADGQLARLTNQGSLHGAFVDGFADYLVYLSIYLHLVLRYLAGGGSNAIWLLAAAAGASHVLQSMLADYYRGGYLRFVARKPRAEIDSASEMQIAYEQISWHDLRRKLAMRTYLNYVRQQEALVPKLLELRTRFRDQVPVWLTRNYRELCRPLLKWTRMLSTNCRMLLLAIFLLLGRPHWFFWSELTLLNVVLIFLIGRHSTIYGRLLARSHGEIGE